MGSSDYNWDALGLRPRQGPRLASVDVNYYGPAIQFLARYLKELGFDVERAHLEPYTERWMFYEHPRGDFVDSTFIVAVPHDVVETLLVNLVKPPAPPAKGKKIRISSKDEQEWP